MERLVEGHGDLIFFLFVNIREMVLNRALKQKTCGTAPM
jgi:hypothetical protein